MYRLLQYRRSIDKAPHHTDKTTFAYSYFGHQSQVKRHSLPFISEHFVWRPAYTKLSGVLWHV